MTGGVFLAVLPTVTGQGQQVAAIALLTLACMTVNGADGPEVSWIVSLLTPSVSACSCQQCCACGCNTEPSALPPRFVLCCAAGAAAGPALHQHAGLS